MLLLSIISLGLALMYQYHTQCSTRAGQRTCIWGAEMDTAANSKRKKAKDRQTVIEQGTNQTERPIVILYPRTL